MEIGSIFADFGNTSLKLLYKDSKGKEHFSRILWSTGYHSIAEKIISIVSKCQFPQINAISVNSIAENRVRKILSKNGIGIKKVQKKLLYPTTSSYDLSRIGMDRIANINAAGKLFAKKNILLIDSGTAVTIEVIVGGHHKGGFILPGEKTLLASLHENTAALPRVTKLEMMPLPGKNTIEAISNGCGALFYQGIAALIDSIKEKYCISKVIITGGNGQNIIDSGYLNVRADYLPTLTLHGLKFMSEKENPSYR